MMHGIMNLKLTPKCMCVCVYIDTNTHHSSILKRQIITLPVYIIIFILLSMLTNDLSFLSLVCVCVCVRACVRACVCVCPVYCPVLFMFVWCGVSVIGHLAVDSARQQTWAELNYVLATVVCGPDDLHRLLTFHSWSTVFPKGNLVVPSLFIACHWLPFTGLRTSLLSQRGQ